MLFILRLISGDMCVVFAKGPAMIPLGFFSSVIFDFFLVIVHGENLKV